MGSNWVGMTHLWHKFIPGFHLNAPTLVQELNKTYAFTILQLQKSNFQSLVSCVAKKLISYAIWNISMWFSQHPEWIYLDNFEEVDHSSKMNRIWFLDDFRSQGCSVYYVFVVYRYIVRKAFFHRVWKKRKYTKRHKHIPETDR